MKAEPRRQSPKERPPQPATRLEEQFPVDQAGHVGQQSQPTAVFHPETSIIARGISTAFLDPPGGEVTQDIVLLRKGTALTPNLVALSRQVSGNAGVHYTLQQNLEKSCGEGLGPQDVSSVATGKLSRCYVQQLSQRNCTSIRTREA